MKKSIFAPVILTLTLSILSVASVSWAGKAYVVNRKSNDVSVIDTNTNTVVKTIPVGRDPLDVGVNPSRSVAYVANNGSGSFSIIDTASDTVINTLDADWPMGIAVDPSGNRIFISEWEGSYGLLHVVDAASYGLITSLQVGNQPWRIATNADGSRTCVANYQDSTITVIDTAGLRRIGTVPCANPMDIAVVSSGTHAYACNTLQSQVSIIDTSGITVPATIPVPAYPQGIAVASDGTKVYVASAAFTVSVIDTGSQSIVASIRVGNGAWGIALNADNSRVYITNVNEDTVSVIDTAMNVVVATIPVGSYPISVAVLP